MSPISAPTSAPSGRQQDVLAGAAALFNQLGFHRANLSDIAASAGITASAIYRYYPSKHHLLAAVIETGTVLAEQVVEDLAARQQTATESVDDAATEMARLAVEHPEYGATIQRDTRSLLPEDRERIRQRWHVIVNRLASLLEGVEGADAEFVSRAAFAVTASPSYSGGPRPVTGAQRELLAGAIRTVLDGRHVSGIPPMAPPERPISALRERASRRQAIMSVATRLFAMHRFHNVSMEQIAEVADITVPTVYSYFEDKATLMASAQWRATAWLHLAMTHALEQGGDPRDQLVRALQSYAEFGVKFADHVAVLVHEIPNLPDEFQPSARLGQREYVSELVRLVQLSRPGLDPHDARVLIRAALGVVNELTRTTRYRGRPHLAEELSSMGTAICLLPIGS